MFSTSDKTGGTVMTPEPAVADEIKSFIVENWEFFARWNNGQAAPDEIEWLANRTCDDWHLVNAAMPEVVSTKDRFLSFVPSILGRFTEDPVTPRIDFLVVAQLANDVYLISIMQHYDFASGKTTSRVITELIAREDGRLKVQYVHE